MVAGQLRSLWTEPRAPGAPTRVWRDWALLAVLVVVAAVEMATRHGGSWPAVAVLEVLVLGAALLWRRSRPLSAVLIGFGTVILVDLASIAADTDAPVSLDSMVFLLVLVYALWRWGAGQAVAIGSVVLPVAYVVGLVRAPLSVLEAILGLVVLLFPAVLGASVRFWQTARTRELDQARLREREQLARELHDTVAHHVSAMVVQAQAGRAVAGSRPAAAIEALAVIEDEGSRTLAEMRTMVGALRDSSDPELAPQRGVADIDRLSQLTAGEARVAVTTSGDLADLSPSVSTAAYRIAQESVTNARRHARRATGIDVLVVGEPGWVRVTVRDDGQVSPGARPPAGYGVVGMTERVSLLGGTLEVGPGPDGGWVVDARLPRTGPGR